MAEPGSELNPGLNPGVIFHLLSPALDSDDRASPNNIMHSYSLRFMGVDVTVLLLCERKVNPC